MKARHIGMWLGCVAVGFIVPATIGGVMMRIVGPMPPVAAGAAAFVASMGIALAAMELCVQYERQRAV